MQHLLKIWVLLGIQALLMYHEIFICFFSRIKHFENHSFISTFLMLEYYFPSDGNDWVLWRLLTFFSPNWMVFAFLFDFLEGEPKKKHWAELLQRFRANDLSIVSWRFRQLKSQYLNSYLVGFVRFFDVFKLDGFGFSVVRFNWRYLLRILCKWLFIDYINRLFEFQGHLFRGWFNEDIKYS